ncbi:MAG: SCO2-like protein [Leptospiraceae bacterium]|nr:MAG: SCO2-like protein [Leptospiraceae bacterium]
MILFMKKNILFCIICIGLFFCLKEKNKDIYKVTLIDQNQQKINWYNYHQYYKLVFLGYTNCPDICPLAVRTMDQVKLILGNKPLLLIFITIDPERDIPDRLKNYLSNFKSQIIGLTGNKEDLYVFYRYFNISYKLESLIKTNHKDHNTIYGYNHTPFIYFLSPEDDIIKTFPTGISSNTLSKELRNYLD